MGNVTRTLRIVAVLGDDTITVKLEPGDGVNVNNGFNFDSTLARVPPIMFRITVASGLSMVCGMIVNVEDVRNVQPIITTLVKTCGWRVEPAKIRTDIPNTQLSACPQLRVYGTTDVVTGDNFAMAVLGTSRRVYVRYPCLTVVTAGKGCTLVSKLVSVLDSESTAQDFLKYALLRYFLWYLITSEWTVLILTRSNTRRFFRALRTSSYACWIEYFVRTGLMKYERYFIE